MKKIAILASALLLSASLCGCVAEPAPYYAGGAPYYGTTYAPAYAYGSVTVGNYYPYQRSQHIYSNYNTNYWHNQRSAGAQHAQAHSAPQRGAPQRGGEEHR